MDGFWVRQNGRQFWAGDLDAVIRMVADGRLAQDDEVFTGQQWERVRDYPPLHTGRKADPFEAWSDADEVDADSAYQSYVGKEPPQGLRAVPRPPPEPAPRPAAEPPRPATEPARGPTKRPPRAVIAAPPGPSAASSVPLPQDEDEATDPGIQEPSPPPRGEVIDFPRPSVARPVALPPPPRREPPRPAPLVRPGRVLAYILIGALGLGGWFGWVRWAGTSDAGISKPPAERPEVVTTDTELDQVERELRSLLDPDPRDIKGEGVLADALLIDLQRMRIDVATVDATVSQWTGRLNDQPARASLRVVIASARDLDRTIGAIALVVGRYERAYHLTLEDVDIVLKTEEGDRGRSLDPKRAEDFYMARIGLEKMLEP